MGTFEVVLNAYCVMILLSVYGGLGVECSSLDITGTHKLTGSVTIMRCGTVGVGVALLEEVTVGWALRFLLVKLHSW